MAYVPTAYVANQLGKDVILAATPDIKRFPNLARLLIGRCTGIGGIGGIKGIWGGVLPRSTFVICDLSFPTCRLLYGLLFVDTTIMF